jgi:Uma2 family endonuclease
MTALPKHKLTADEFLAWAEAQPKEAGVFELHDGDVVMRHGPITSQQAEKSQHWETKGAIFAALREAIERAGLPCFAAVDGPMVRVASGKTYRPDALVYCGERAPRGVLEVSNPIIIAEVLSPGSESVDYGDKLEAYFTIASLHHYLVIDPARPAMVHYERAAEGTVAIHIVKSTMLRLDPPGLDAELGEVLGLETG